MTELQLKNYIIDTFEYDKLKKYLIKEEYSINTRKDIIDLIDINLYGGQLGVCIDNYEYTLLKADIETSEMSCSVCIFCNFDNYDCDDINFRKLLSSTKSNILKTTIIKYFVKKVSQKCVVFNDSKRDNTIYNCLTKKYFPENNYHIVEFPTTDGRSTMRHVTYVK